VDEDGVRYRRFHVIDNDGLDIGSVTAAILYDGEDAGEHLYRVQFSYASPREKTINKKKGQILAKLRLFSSDPERGAIIISLKEQNRGLTNTIRELIIDEAQRKRISWLRDTAMNQLV
jgi:hypothetical protein